MKMDVEIYRAIKSMPFKEMQRYLDRIYREAFMDGRNDVLGKIDKRLETIPEGELRSQYQLGVYDALMAVKNE